MKGLTSQQAQQLLSEQGTNTIQEKHTASLWKKFFEQLSSVLILLLIFASIFSFFIGEYVDGSLILIIVFLNALFGVYQEHKADQAVESLKKFTVATVRVKRDGKEQVIESKYLVPGDIVFLEEGDKVPADAEVLECIRLEVNEASLTGESVPVIKTNGDKVYLGTIVSKGHAVVCIQLTGMKTKFGQIAQKLSEVKTVKTPLQKKLETMTKMIGAIGMLASLLVFVVSILSGSAYFPSFLLAISLAVAVVPESLPAVMTATLSIGVNRMAKRNAIVRKLSAIEALGSTSLIATDKTGTLTTNEMRVKSIFFNGKELSSHQLNEWKDSEHLKLLLLDGIICSTASLVHSHDPKNPKHHTLQVLGDPTEGALLLLAKELNVDIEHIRTQWSNIDEIPFDPVVKRMTIVAKHDHTFRVFSKGAPESILSISTSELVDGKEQALSEEKKEFYLSLMKKWANKGLRVLAFSYSHGTKNPEKDHIFIGLIAMYDPPRKEVTHAIHKARNAGIQIVMITGDNEHTAEAIAEEIGLLEKGDITITGNQIDDYSDEELLQLLPKTRIFARTTPFHKQKIVSLFQHLGEIVAVTGDGVNDAIALKQGDIGIAMGKTGTDVAKDVSDMVMMDDNFATIVNAVEEGRNIVKRLRNAIMYLLSCNISEALSLLIGLLIGLPPIFLPIQLLYINLISDGIPALAFAFSPSDTSVMHQKPQSKMVLLERRHYMYIGSVGIMVTIIVLFSYFFLNGPSLIGRRTTAFSIMAMIQTFVFVDIWIRITQGNIWNKRFGKLFFFTTAIPIIFQFILLRSEFFASLFQVSKVTIGTFGIYFFFSLSIAFLIFAMRKTYSVYSKFHMLDTT